MRGIIDISKTMEQLVESGSNRLITYTIKIPKIPIEFYEHIIAYIIINSKVNAIIKENESDITIRCKTYMLEMQHIFNWFGTIPNPGIILNGIELNSQNKEWKFFVSEYDRIKYDLCVWNDYTTKFFTNKFANCMVQPWMINISGKKESELSKRVPIYTIQDRSDYAAKECTSISFGSGFKKKYGDPIIILKEEKLYDIEFMFNGIAATADKFDVIVYDSNGNEVERFKEITEKKLETLGESWDEKGYTIKQEEHPSDDGWYILGSV